MLFWHQARLDRAKLFDSYQFHDCPSRFRFKASSFSVVEVGAPASAGGGVGAGESDLANGVIGFVDERGADPDCGGSGRSSRFDFRLALTACFVCSNAPMVAVAGARRRKVIAFQIAWKSIWIRRIATSSGTRIASAIRNQSKIGWEFRFGMRA